MLVLSRKVGERIQIGEDIHLVVLKSTGGRVQVGIDAPQEISIRRCEVPDQSRSRAVPLVGRSSTQQPPFGCCLCD